MTNIYNNRIFSPFLKKYFSKKSTGLSLVEISLVLLISLLIIGGIGYGYQNASNSSKLTELQSNLIVLRSQINQVFADSTSYEGLSNDVARKAGAIPNSFIKGDVIVNQFDGNLTVTPTDDSSAFAIELTKIPNDVCTKLGSFQHSLWLSTKVNSTEIENGSIISLTTACSGDDNTLTFTAR